jgi:hypothetical protein
MAEEYNYPPKPRFYIWDQYIPGETPTLKSYSDTPYYQTWLQKLQEEKDELAASQNSNLLCILENDCDQKPTTSAKLLCCTDKAKKCAGLWADLEKTISDFAAGKISGPAFETLRADYQEKIRAAGCCSFGVEASTPPFPPYSCWWWDPYDMFDTFAKCRRAAHEESLRKICNSMYKKAEAPIVRVSLEIEDRTTNNALVGNGKTTKIAANGMSRAEPPYI